MIGKRRPKSWLGVGPYGCGTGGRLLCLFTIWTCRTTRREAKDRRHGWPPSRRIGGLPAGFSSCLSPTRMLALHPCGSHARLRAARSILVARAYPLCSYCHESAGNKSFSRANRSASPWSKSAARDSRLWRSLCAWTSGLKGNCHEPPAYYPANR